MIWSRFMTEAHRGVQVAQLPGTDLVAYLLGSQPPPGPPIGLAQADGDALQQWISQHGGAIAAPAPPPPAPTERRGFFRRLFGG
jgi:hypothetical protein